MPSFLERISIRWRLGVTSAVLTFVILCGFAAVVSESTARRLRSDFTSQTRLAADVITGQIRVTLGPNGFEVQPDLAVYAAPDRASIRVLNAAGDTVKKTRNAPDFGFPRTAEADVRGFRVITRRLQLYRTIDGGRAGTLFIQYGRRLSDVDGTITRIRTFLLLGVLGGTALALLAGLMIARRAMAPIAALTATTREIARTRDPNRRVPVPRSDDEVSELARTLDDMLRALESSRVENAAMLDRQRDFVADASHELRTPLTSVLANLELLSEVLDGDARDAADSALRSSQRMRRLVADLLLLARADARRSAARERLDLSRVVVDAAAELGPLAAAGHRELLLETPPGLDVIGARDELHRVALNLMDNAMKHTPEGTRVHAVASRDGDDVVLRVRDKGPGVPLELRERLFERFVRGAGDRGGSSGLGLSIVRAVAEAHGGSVDLEDPTPDERGAHFVVRLPAAPVTDDGVEQAEPDPATAAAG